MRAFRSRLTYANVMSTIGVFLAIGGGAYAVAAIPAKDGKISGCYAKKTGQLRVVSSKRKCKRRVETYISWNQRGVQGLPGPAGTPDGYTRGEADSRFLPSGGTAANSALLEGLPSSAFESAGATTFGRANQTYIPGVEVISVPSVGFRVLTDGDADTDGSIRVQSTRTSGDLEVLHGGGGAVLSPGQTSAADVHSFATNSDAPFLWERTVNVAGGGPGAVARCYFSGSDVTCIAIAG